MSAPPTTLRPGLGSARAAIGTADRPPTRALSRLVAARRVSPWVIALLLAAFVTYTDRPASTSGWENTGGVAGRVFFAFMLGRALIRRGLPLFLAHGQTRRGFLGHAAVVTAAYTGGGAAVMAAGLLAEGGAHRLQGWPHLASGSHLFDAPQQVGLVVVEYWLLLTVWAVAGALVAPLGPFASGHRQLPFLIRQLHALVAVALVVGAELAVGGMLPFGLGGFEATQPPVLVAVVVCAAAVGVGAAAVCWRLGVLGRAGAAGDSQRAARAGGSADQGDEAGRRAATRPPYRFLAPSGLTRLVGLAGVLGVLAVVLAVVDRNAAGAAAGGRPDGPAAVAVVAGGSHTCSLRDDGTVACWGDNEVGQLGDGTTAGRASPAAVESLEDAVEVAAGWVHSCARREGGSVACWGHNRFGQLGDGTTADRTVPAAVEDLVDVVAVAAGGRHTCAVKQAGTVACWGLNHFGQLGDGTTTRRRTPVAMEGLVDAVAVAAGEDHTCALREGGSVACWGQNRSGQLGDGTTVDRVAPVTVEGLADAVAVAAGGQHSCVLREGGSVACWGLALSGQLGFPSVQHRFLRPDSVHRPGWRRRVPLTDAVQVAAGYFDTCVLRDGGTVSCDATRELLPAGVVAVTAGGGHACALRDGGSVACWGENLRGQLGNSATRWSGR